MTGFTSPFRWGTKFFRRLWRHPNSPYWLVQWSGPFKHFGPLEGGGGGGAALERPPWGYPTGTPSLEPELAVEKQQLRLTVTGLGRNISCCGCYMLTRRDKMRWKVVNERFDAASLQCIGHHLPRAGTPPTRSCMTPLLCFPFLTNKS